MADELRVPDTTLAEIRHELGKGRDALEGAGSSAPRTVDAGNMAAMLTGMMAKVLDNTATMSEGLAGVSSLVGEAGTSFWETDAAVATSYSGRGIPVGH